jgi:DNA-3-methyladenine glycosylase
MSIDRALNGHDLLSANFFIAEPPNGGETVRIGVDYAGHWARRLLRFYIRGNPCVSRP